MRHVALSLLVAALVFPSAAVADEAGGSIGSTTSVWTTPVSGDQLIDPRSAELVAGLVNTVNQGYASGRYPWISVRKCAARIYTVPADQPTVRVSLLDGDRPARVSLQAALSAIPLPADAIPSDCPDATIVVEQPSTDRMWELWHAHNEVDGWHADWGGATQHMSTNIGSYGPSDWPGALSTWGASASSMTLAPGVMRTAELERGQIDHAIALSLPQTAAGMWAWPAQRTDGVSAASDALPYGAHLRLDPSIDVDAMDVPPAAKVILHAAQTYGLIVREQTHYCVQLSAEAAPPNDPGFYQRVLGGYAGPIMRAIPWQDMQVLRMSLFSKLGPVTIAPTTVFKPAIPSASTPVPAPVPVRSPALAPAAHPTATPTRAPTVAPPAVASPTASRPPTRSAAKPAHSAQPRARRRAARHRKRAAAHRRRRHRRARHPSRTRVTHELLRGQRRHARASSRSRRRA